MSDFVYSGHPPRGSFHSASPLQPLREMILLGLPRGGCGDAVPGGAVHLSVCNTSGVGGPIRAAPINARRNEVRRGASRPLALLVAGGPPAPFGIPSRRWCEVAGRKAFGRQRYHRTSRWWCLWQPGRPQCRSTPAVHGAPVNPFLPPSAHPAPHSTQLGTPSAAPLPPPPR